MKQYRRSLPQLWDLWRPAARKVRNLFRFTDYADVERVMTGLTSYDPEAWAQAWSAEALPHEERGHAAKAAGDEAEAMARFLSAYAYHRIARYPTTTSPSKIVAYRKSLALFLEAAAFFDPPLERVTIPFPARDGEKDVIVGYLRRARGTTPSPLVVNWSGTDTWKEELNDRVDPFLERGLSVLLLDMPGTGEAPIVGSLDAERMFAAALDWAGARPEFDPRRICVYGGSFGGYWAVKVAHLYRDRIACAVNQGGGVHFDYEVEWNLKMEYGEYPFDPMETRAAAFGLATLDEWLELSPKLSLLRMGLLDQPCAPMLLVNGVHDTITDPRDFQLLLEHGDPKTVRLYPTGHMGMTPTTLATIATWVRAAC